LVTYPASGKAERFRGMAPSFYVAVDRFGAPLTPEQPAGKINVTDPDSRTLKTARGSFRATAPRRSAHHRVDRLADLRVLPQEHQSPRGPWRPRRSPANRDGNELPASVQGRKDRRRAGKGCSRWAWGRARGPKPVVIAPEGELDLHSVDSLAPQLDEATGADYPHLILDLSAVIRGLHRSRRHRTGPASLQRPRAQALGRRAPGSAAAVMLELSGLRSRFSLFASRDTASA
jgi:hypothetical protein